MAYYDKIVSKVVIYFFGCADDEDNVAMTIEEQGNLLAVADNYDGCYGNDRNDYCY